MQMKPSEACLYMSSKAELQVEVIQTCVFVMEIGLAVKPLPIPNLNLSPDLIALRQPCASSFPRCRVYRQPILSIIYATSN